MGDSAKFVANFFTFLLSTAVAGLVAFLVCYSSNNQAAKTYKKLILAERIKRLTSLRQCMVDYLSKSYYILNLRYDKDSGELLGNDQNSAEITQLSFLLKLVLNPQQDNQRNLADILCELDELAQKLLSMPEDVDSMFDLYEYKIAEFSKMCQEVLKDEWDIIKPDTAVNEAVIADSTAENI